MGKAREPKGVAVAIAPAIAAAPLPPNPAFGAAVLHDVDTAMWLRAREGDVAAAKVVYARLSEQLAQSPSAPPLPPTWAELAALYKKLQQQQKELSRHDILDDAAGVGAGKD